MTFLSRTTRLMEAPLSVEERLQQLADLAVVGDRRLVRRAPRARRPGGPGGGGAQRPGEGRVRRAAAGALPARPRRAGRGAAGEPHRRARLSTPTIPDELLVGRRRRRRAPRPHPVDRDALRGGRAAGRARAEAGRAHLGAGGVRATLRPTPTSRSPQQLAATAAIALDNARLYEEQWRTAHTLQAALLPTDLPRCPGCASPPATAPTADADVLVGGDLYDVVPEPDGRAASSSRTSAARARRPPRSPRSSGTPCAPRSTTGTGPPRCWSGSTGRCSARAAGGPAGSRPSRRPASPDTARRHRAAGQRGAPAAARGPRRPGRSRARAGHAARRSTRTSP